MIKMAVIEGVVGKNGTYIFLIQHTIDKKSIKKIHFGTHIEREPHTGQS